MTDIVERLRRLIALADEADDQVDKETYDQMREQGFDAPSDCEMWVTAGSLRKINRVFAEIYAIKRKLAKETPPYDPTTQPYDEPLRHVDTKALKLAKETKP